MKRMIVIGVIVVLAMSMVPAVVTAQDDPSLGETFEDGGISVSLPEGWAARSGESGGIEIVNDPKLFELMDDDVESGTPSGGFALLILDPSGFTDMVSTLSLNDIMGIMAQSMANNADLEVGDLVDTTVDELEAVRFPVADPADETDGFMLGYLIDDETMMMVVGVAHLGELDQYEETAAAIMASIVFDPAGALVVDVPEPVMVETVSGLGLTMTLPEGWAADVAEDGLTLANGEETLADALADEEGGPGPGQVALFVLPPVNVEDLGGMMMVDLMDVFVDGLMSDSPDASVVVPMRELEIGDYTSIFSMVIIDGEGAEFELIGYQPTAGVYVVAIAAAPEGEYVEHQVTVYEIIVSMISGE